MKQAIVAIAMKSPAAAARQLVDHPALLGGLITSGELPEVVDLLAEAGLHDHLYRMAHDISGPVQARMFIKSELGFVN